MFNSVKSSNIFRNLKKIPSEFIWSTVGGPFLLLIFNCLLFLFPLTGLSNLFGSVQGPIQLIGKRETFTSYSK